MKKADKFCSSRTFHTWVENFLLDLKHNYDPKASVSNTYLGLSYDRESE